MSSYLVAPEDINRVITHLRNTEGHYRIVDCLLAPAGYAVGCEADCEHLAQAMFALNIRALMARYGDKAARDGDASDYHYCAVLGNQFAALKALRCWLYQCAEGSVPEHPLYRAMDAVRDEWQTQIVDGLPQFRQAVGW